MMREENLSLWAETVLKDQYSDILQSRRRGDATVSGGDALLLLKNIAPILRPTLDVGCGGGVDDSFDFLLDPSEIRAKANPRVVSGWLEALPFENESLGFILAWGVVFYARSMVEAFMEMNRVLQIGGDVILNMVTETTQALAQTVNRRSFINWVGLFGFELIAQVNIDHPGHKQFGLRIRKVSAFDPARFRLPQCQGGRIANYLPERDWYLQ